jgi:DNA-binding response OmpR family regulator
MNDLNLESLSKSQLIERIDELEMRLEDMKPKHSDVLLAAWVFGIPKQLAEALCALRKGRRLEKNQLLAACAGRDAMANGDTKLADVVICKLRKKLANTPIEIKTVWGIGYEMIAGFDFFDEKIEERRYK